MRWKNITMTQTIQNDENKWNNFEIVSSYLNSIDKDIHQQQNGQRENYLDKLDENSRKCHLLAFSLFLSNQIYDKIVGR